MDIQEYLKPRGRVAFLARAIGAPKPDVSDWKNGQREVPVRRCRDIVRATNNLVTYQELRPNDWQDYWGDFLPMENT